MWFGSLESNTIRPRKNEVVLLKLDLTRVSLTLSSFSDPREVASIRAFYSSRSGSYNEFQGSTAGLGAGKTLYCRASHRSGVANNVFNDVGTSGLVACLTTHGQQCGAVLLHCWGIVAMSDEWSIALVLCCSRIVATRLTVLPDQSY
jgi:hypothetical protein